jgi:hypothetical protein
MLYKRNNPQLNKNGELIHLLSTEGLSKDILTHILDTAASFVSVSDREVKKVPLLRGKSVFKTAPAPAPPSTSRPPACRPTFTPSTLHARRPARASRCWTPSPT